MSDIFLHSVAKERVTNKLDTVQSLPWGLRSLHVTEPWLLLTGDISSSQRKAKPLFLRAVTIWMNFCLHFRSVFLWHVLKNAAFITKWLLCSPGCVVPVLEIAYLCKMWVVQVWHFLNNTLRRVSSLSLSSYWVAVQLSLKTGIKPVGSCYLSPWPTLETLPVQSCRGLVGGVFLLRQLGEQHTNVFRTLPI